MLNLTQNPALSTINYQLSTINYYDASKSISLITNYLIEAIRDGLEERTKVKDKEVVKAA